MATISLLIRDDNMAEVDETFNLLISKTSDNRVVAGPENVATVTIVDQDSEWVACGLITEQWLSVGVLRVHCVPTYLADVTMATISPSTHCELPAHQLHCVGGRLRAPSPRP